MVIIVDRVWKARDMLSFHSSAAKMDMRLTEVPKWILLMRDQNILPFNREFRSDLMLKVMGITE